MEYLKSNIVLLKWMISEGYSDPRMMRCSEALGGIVNVRKVRTLARRVAKMEAWLENPTLTEAGRDFSLCNG
eukprot:1331887-Amphidinium_carterae.1